MDTVVTRGIAATSTTASGAGAGAPGMTTGMVEVATGTTTTGGRTQLAIIVTATTAGIMTVPLCSRRRACRPRKLTLRTYRMFSKGNKRTGITRTTITGSHRHTARSFRTMHIRSTCLPRCTKVAGITSIMVAAAGAEGAAEWAPLTQLDRDPPRIVIQWRAHYQANEILTSQDPS